MGRLNPSSEFVSIKDQFFTFPIEWDFFFQPKIYLLNDLPSRVNGITYKNLVFVKGDHGENICYH